MIVLEKARETAPLEGVGRGAVVLGVQGARTWITVPNGHEPSPASGLNPSGEVAIPPQARAEMAIVSTRARTTINVLRRVLRTFILPTSCSFVCGHALPTAARSMGFTGLTAKEMQDIYVPALLLSNGNHCRTL